MFQTSVNGAWDCVPEVSLAVVRLFRDDIGYGRKLRDHRVTATAFDDDIERLVRTYVAGKEEGEAFHRWVARSDEGMVC